MKTSQEYPNFQKALLHIIADKNPYCVSNDNKKLAYQIPLGNFKRGFDFYELNRAKDGSIYFTIVTMVGFKTICETNSKYHQYDLPFDLWVKEILNVVIIHFQKPEYVVTKRGSIKKLDFEREREYRKELERKAEDIRIDNLPKDERYAARVERFQKSSQEFFELSLRLANEKNKGCTGLLGIVVIISFMVIGISI
ncbi:hypothetical protein [Winogradskyella sediminis]|uniref:hypothetical protein n=1 Tax=Winogradskyella sediminis TaxID=1382466 RepID=UPI003AA9C01D